MGLLRWVGTSFAVAATGAGAFVWYKNRPPPREELMAIELEVERARRLRGRSARRR
jgi:hypothetical protein